MKEYEARLETAVGNPAQVRHHNQAGNHRFAGTLIPAGRLNGDANSLEYMYTLINDDRRNEERIFPYLGGEEFNSDPRLEPCRFIIDFGEMTEEEARKWPDLFKIVESRVKPARALVTQRDRRELWWLYATRCAIPTDHSVTENERCLGISRVTNAFAFGFVTETSVIFGIR